MHEAPDEVAAAARPGRSVHPGDVPGPEQGFFADTDPLPGREPQIVRARLATG